MIRPAAVLTDSLRGDQKAGARNRAVDAELSARTVEEARLAQEPQRIAGRNPVCAEVLRVAVARQGGVLAGVEHLVHLADELLVNNVVRVKDEKAVIGHFALVLEDVVEQVFEGVALADLHLVKALIDISAGVPRDFRSVVRAVVRNDVNIEQLGRVILLLQRAYQVGDDRRLVARRNDCRIAVQLCVLVAALALADPADNQVDDLIGVSRREEYKQDKLHTFQKS